MSYIPELRAARLSCGTLMSDKAKAALGGPKPTHPALIEIARHELERLNPKEDEDAKS